MSNKEYYTVEVNGKVKIQTKDYKSAYETTIFQRILKRPMLNWAIRY